MIKYGKVCRDDTECKSRICEMTYDNAGEPKGRLCVIQNVKYGNSCVVNSDCPSDRCVMTYESPAQGGLPLGKRCIIKKNQEPLNTDILGSDTPDLLKDSDRNKALKSKRIIINPYTKQLAFRGRGPVAKFAVVVIELLLDIVFKILKVIWDVWKMVFKGIYWLLFGSWEGPLGNLRKKWGNSSLISCYDISIFRYLVTILFPPFGVFMAKGISGWFYIVTCCFLTALFYFPGLMYAFIVMRGSSVNLKNVIRT